MRLTKQTGHAMRILIDCAHAEGELVKVAEISARLGITKQNVFKIVHLLSRAGFISASRGPSGGVRLAKPAELIRIGDVVRSIEATDVEIEGDTRPSSADGTREINNMFDDALAAFVSVLDQHTLAEMAQPRQQSRPVTAEKTRGEGRKQLAAAKAGRGRRPRERQSAI